MTGRGGRVIAAIGLLVLSPVLLVISAAILVLDGRPIFFRQTRMGRDMQPFVLIKFRSMRTARGRSVEVTQADDPRITRIGGVLRRTKLDELPQLLNVVRGEMCLVGPRPEVEGYVAHYPDEFSRLLELPPGITDPASLAFRCEQRVLEGATDPESIYLSTILPAKLRISLDYKERRTIWSDLRVVAQTVLPLQSGDEVIDLDHLDRITVIDLRDHDETDRHEIDLVS